MLCDKCSNIHFRPDPDTILILGSYANRFRALVYDHHDTITALRESASECTSCRQLLYKLIAETVLPEQRGPNMDMTIDPSIDPDSGPVRLTTYSQYCFGNFDSYGAIRRRGGPASDRDLLIESDICHRPDIIFLSCPSFPQVTLEIINDKWDYIDPNLAEADRALDSHLLSDRTYDLAGRWLSDCENLHGACESDGAPLPLWVIELAREELSAKIVPGGGRTELYATLSYKWGASARYTMTSANKLALQQNIPLDRIPKTFADAITVAWNLGYQYLWIDALCITQDCADEVRDQIAAMRDVYSGSELTLFAAAGDSVDAGLDCARDAAMVRPVQWIVRIQKASNEAVEIERTVVRGCYGGFSVADMPLYERGWVLQEQVLSRRSLIFTDCQILWQCLENGYSESFQFKPYYYYLESPVQDGLASARHWILTGNTDRHYSDAGVMDSFYDLIEAYCARQLTFPGDVLPAIAGLVGVYSRHFEQTFTAGTCLQSLSGIMWYVYESPNPPSLDRSPTVPFWSWISRFGSRLRFAHNAQEEHRIVDSTRIQLAQTPTADETRLEIRAWTRRATAVSYWAEKAHDSPCRVNELRSSEGLVYSNMIFYPDFCEHTPNDHSTTSVAVLLIFAARRYDRTSDRLEWYHIVARAQPDAAGCFQRIGFARDKYGSPPMRGGVHIEDVQGCKAVAEADRRGVGAEYTVQYLV